MVSKAKKDETVEKGEEIRQVLISSRRPR